MASSPEIFYGHWNVAELKARVAALTAAGYAVRGHASTETMAKWGEWRPAAVAISIDRLPSHGRAVAEWVWEAKKRQSIPMIFEGGAPEKVAATQKKFPRAVFCASGSVVAALAKLGAKP
jgi:hypothetical protein